MAMLNTRAFGLNYFLAITQFTHIVKYMYLSRYRYVTSKVGTKLNACFPVITSHTGDDRCPFIV